MREFGLWPVINKNDSYGEMETVRINCDWEREALLLFRASAEEIKHLRNVAWQWS